jgi:hypothetical protein
MRLNYIDYADLPLSVMFVKDDIELLHEFFLFAEANLNINEDFKRPISLKQIITCFAEIHAKLEEV